MYICFDRLLLLAKYALMGIPGGPKASDKCHFSTEYVEIKQPWRCPILGPTFASDDTVDVDTWYALGNQHLKFGTCDRHTCCEMCSVEGTFWPTGRCLSWFASYVHRADNPIYTDLFVSKQQV